MFFYQAKQYKIKALNIKHIQISKRWELMIKINEITKNQTKDL
ncbi:hypothetical protein SOHN41_01499 [Shewanella sp. HN-41]|nr:hypothetical protein SOHN41_01499 [Shewanella sp. HN-41]